MGPIRGRRSSAASIPRFTLPAALLLLISCSGSPLEPARPANADPSVRYTGREACLECHASIGESYARTGMGRSFYPLTPESVVEDFEAHNRLDLPEEGLAYEMTARPDGFWMKQIVLDPEGAVLAEAEHRMIYVLGSGNHSRSYLSGRAGYLYQMPVCWYPDKPGWDLCPGYEHHNQFFGRPADGSCLFCHNARVPLLAGATHRYGEGMPHGIDCERCHGPGELHVARWRNPPEIVPANDGTIVNPAKLPVSSRIHVCLQCHLGDADASERVQRTGADARDFRPGDHLAEYVDVMTFRHASDDRFGLGGQGDRLMLSRCYKESGGALDCLSCHNPHISVYSSETPRNRYRKACQVCHDASACALSEKARRERSAEDDCAACHMRRSEPADQRFTLFTDHWIRRRVDPAGPPGPARTLLEIEPHFPEARGGYAPGEDSLNRGRALLVMRSGNMAGSRIAAAAPEEHLRRAVEENASLAEGWLLLGRTVLNQGRSAEAIGHFRQALQGDPKLRGARLNLASALLGMERAAETEQLLREAIRLKEDDVDALTDLGRALVDLGREEEAERILRRAVALTDVDAAPLANLGLLHARQGRNEEAAAELRRAAALAPSRAEIWSSLAGVLADMGRTQEADAASSRAGRLAKPAHPAGR